MITTSDKWVRLREPFDQLVDSLSAAISDFVRDFLTPGNDDGRRGACAARVAG
jgi:hypothetical protein